MTVQLTGPQAATVLRALADAAAYRRALIAVWCEQCETAPDGSCPEHLADLEAAAAYDGLARALAPSAPAADDLLTRREVAYLLGVTSGVVARWARTGRLTEIRGEDGRPRYRRSEAEALRRAGSPLCRAATVAGRSARSGARGPAAASGLGRRT
jgi:hypothetical protein